MSETSTLKSKSGNKANPADKIFSKTFSKFVHVFKQLANLWIAVFSSWLVLACLELPKKKEQFGCTWDFKPVHQAYKMPFPKFTLSDVRDRYIFNALFPASPTIFNFSFFFFLQYRCMNESQDKKFIPITLTLVLIILLH